MPPLNTAESAAVSAPQEQAYATDSRSDWLRGLRAALPLLVGVIPFALLLGAQAARNGFSAIEMPLLTGLNFAGSSEFVAMRLWTSPPHISLIVAMTFLVNNSPLAGTEGDKVTSRMIRDRLLREAETNVATKIASVAPITHQRRATQASTTARKRL